MRCTKLFSMAGCVVLLGGLATAQPWRVHPEYRQALSDIQTALDELGQMTPDKLAAGDVRAGMAEARAAIDELDEAEGANGVPIGQLPPPPQNFQISPREQNTNRGHLEQAIFLLNSAHNELTRHELNPFAAGDKNRAVYDLNQARYAVDHALRAEGGGQP